MIISKDIHYVNNIFIELYDKPKNLLSNIIIVIVNAEFIKTL